MNEAIKDLQEMKERIELALEEAKNFPCLPEGFKLWSTSEELRFRIPHSTYGIQQGFRILRDAGYTRVSGRLDFTGSDGEKFYHFSKRKVNLLMSTNFQTGAYCKKVKVGEQVTPIYEIVCF